MSSGETSFFVQVCGNLAPIAGIVCFWAPIPTIRQIRTDQSVGSLPLLPYSSMIANCFLWIVYGVLRNETKIWFTNSVGLVLASIYFIIFTKYSPLKSPTLPGSIRQHRHAIVVVVFVTLAFVTMSNNTTGDSDPAGMIGNIAVLFCIAMFGSPLAALKTVLVTKSADSIPLPFTIATCVNCFCWFVLGWYDLQDFNIYFPNLLGLVFGITQVGLKLVFSNGSSVMKPPGQEKLDLIA